MIRFINCLRRRGDIEPVEFRRYWDDPGFAELIERMAAVNGAELYQFHATLIVEANERVRQLRGGEDPYDGIIEYWWPTAPGLDHLLTIPDSRAVFDAMHEYQARFVDFARSTAFFTTA